MEPSAALPVSGVLCLCLLLFFSTCLEFLFKILAVGKWIKFFTIFTPVPFLTRQISDRCFGIK